ncbi:MAG: DUF1573 domain-containing protein [Bacillota bacterium]
MSDMNCNKFQKAASEVLIRHKSILDTITKLQESCGKVNRAVVKSATSCGCIKIYGEKQPVPEDASYEDLHQFITHQVSGELCDICKDKIEKELGNHLFYLVAVANTMKLDVDQILKQQLKQIETLGKFSLY